MRGLQACSEGRTLIPWLGGLQGRRTAVRDAARNSALKESHDPRDGLLRYQQKISPRDEAKREGR